MSLKRTLYTRVYYHAHKPRISELRKRRRRKKDARYYRIHREDITKRYREWYALRPEKNRLYRERNRTRLNANHAKWAKANREKIRSSQRRRYRQNRKRFKELARKRYWCDETGVRQKAKQYCLNHKTHRQESYRFNSTRILHQAKQKVAKLADSYIKNLLISGTILRSVDIPQVLVEAKRNHIKLWRAQQRRSYEIANS